MATNYPYAAVPTKLPELLNKIREVSVPDKATYRWFASLGFKSKNDRSMFRTLKFIGFMDDSGSPTDLWNRYRGMNHRGVLAEAVKGGYSELFGVYPDACSRSQEDLENFFTTKSTAGRQVIVRLVRTFMILCSLADFEATSGPTAVEKTPTARPVAPVISPPSEQPQISPSSSQWGPPLHIDIQIHISSDASPDQIDQIFASMAKYLYRKE